MTTGVSIASILWGHCFDWHGIREELSFWPVITDMCGTERMLSWTHPRGQPLAAKRRQCKAGEIVVSGKRVVPLTASSFRGLKTIHYKRKTAWLPWRGHSTRDGLPMVLLTDRSSVYPGLRHCSYPATDWWRAAPALAPVEAEPVVHVACLLADRHCSTTWSRKRIGTQPTKTRHQRM